MKVVWSRRATADLKAEAEGIAVDRPRVANALVQRIRGAVARLKLFPYSGRTVPELPDVPVREVIVGQYRVLYRVTGGQVVVLMMKHSRQELRAVDLRSEDW